MKKRKCPCCNEEISLRYFFSKMLFGTRPISYTKKEVGLICLKCNKSILSAENKHSMLLFIMPISIIPLIIFGFSDDVSSIGDHIVNFSKGFLLSFMLLLFMLYRKYQNIKFICEDKSSEEFDYYSIHG